MCSAIFKESVPATYNFWCNNCLPTEKYQPHGSRKAEENLKTERNSRREGKLFIILGTVAFTVVLILHSLWIAYELDETHVAHEVGLYNMFRDVNIMIFFGFGFLMAFMKKNAFSAIGYTLFVSAFVCLWSIILESFFMKADEDFDDFASRYGMGIESILNGLFCSGAVMITYGSCLGKISSSQLIVVAIIEPVFYWLNFFIDSLKLNAVDIGGGMYIHTFGAYFGLTLCFFLTWSSTKSSPENSSSYTSDIFALAGSLFLWICWPSFNAVIAETPLDQMRALINTFLSLCGSTVAAFLFSRLRSVMHANWRFDIIHIQNATLAGGVVMGVAAHLDILPATAIGMGFLSGGISTLGYQYLTPLLERFLRIQDVCGVHNLHGMPGLLGSIFAVFVTLGLSQQSDNIYLGHGSVAFHEGTNQPGHQMAAIVITLFLAVSGGIITGIICYLMKFWTSRFYPEDYFTDRVAWHVPKDFENIGLTTEEMIEALNRKKKMADEAMPGVGNEKFEGMSNVDLNDEDNNSIDNDDDNNNNNIEMKKLKKAGLSSSMKSQPKEDGTKRKQKKKNGKKSEPSNNNNNNKAEGSGSTESDSDSDSD